MFTFSLAMSPRKRARPNPVDGTGASSTASLPLPRPGPEDTHSRLRPGPEAAASSPNLSIPSKPSQAPAPEIQASDKGPSVNGNPSQPLPKQVKKTRSWYGSWPRAPRAKTAPSTQVARESILGGTLKPDTTLDLSHYDAKKASADDTSDAAADNGGVATLSTLSRIGENEPDGAHANTVSEPAAAVTPSREPSDTTEGAAAKAPSPAEQVPQIATTELPQQPTTSSGWLGWLSRPAAVVAAPAPPEPPAAEGNKPATPLEQEQAQDRHAVPKANDMQESSTNPHEIVPPKSPPLPDPTSSSWFGFWPARAPAKQPEPVDDQDVVKKDGGPTSQLTVGTEPAKEQEDVVMQDAPVTSPQAQPAGSTWAFWSRDTKRKPGSAGASTREPGEIAVMGQGSEAHPQPASNAEVNSTTPVAKESAPGTHTKDSGKKTKRLRPQSMDTDEPGARPGTPASSSSVAADSASIRSAMQTSDSTAKNPGTNLLLPSFRSTYRMKGNPSILHQIRRFLLRTQQSPPSNHVFLAREPPKIKKALAIGVHGLFPATYLRPMIGQPTGTSIKFANHCADSIRRWADSHGCEGCEIQKVALEGEGKIGDRVENLWKLLLNWIDLIRQADLIMLACHSQGVPVGIMLVAKLIELGVVTSPRIGVCAMAGVSLGPFPSYQSGMGMLMGTAAELWEFANPESEVSKRLEASLQVVLAHGVRVTYIGSIDDQVVPLESALYSSASHPLLYRAVFVDARVHAPDFIAHLVGFALKLRNMGVSDHGLIRELSVPLAGSLYSGAGHSTLYDDPQVYDLAISHALETSDVGRVPCEIRKHEGITNPNPYHLPWIMRGLLEEDLARTELSSEVAELLAQFDDWKPVTKALKDVKYRLEAVRSKL
ncbi:hypothetical protein MAPG_08101 [Magnaporthiopsis poae ATCC 64411]|uniref:YMC020W-like alpha/beta hydrolase domain-containing protein n=1 Tax=Magnaporthiopsis poae (strain ATCC 64411 / 73-15) TaxID=644358 RepID=A0A0C4E6G2_MAGP6|nr:hypothetical protein MAPG_08101 [Magnaporthiopsis poae ATCC 64411]